MTPQPFPNVVIKPALSKELIKIRLALSAGVWSARVKVTDFVQPSTRYVCVTFPSPIISKPPSTALAVSPVHGDMVVYSANASFETNIVSLAPESMKVGIVSFASSWKLLLMRAIGVLSSS